MSKFNSSLSFPSSNIKKPPVVQYSRFPLLILKEPESFFLIFYECKTISCQLLRYQEFQCRR